MYKILIVEDEILSAKDYCIQSNGRKWTVWQLARHETVWKE